MIVDEFYYLKTVRWVDFLRLLCVCRVRFVYFWKVWHVRNVDGAKVGGKGMELAIGLHLTAPIFCVLCGVAVLLSVTVRHTHAHK